MGVNVHFIDDDLEMNSFTIALERFSGIRDHLSVAIRLNDIYKKFGINGKVGAVTTDGGSELVACFKHCGDDYVSYDGWCREDEDTLWPFDDQIENEEIDDDDIVPLASLANDEEISEAQLNHFLAAIDKMGNEDDEICVQMVDLQSVDEDPIEELPIRIQCGAHSLNSLCKNDAHYALKSSAAYRATYVIVFRKLNQLWKNILQKRGGETIRKYLGKNLIRPHKIRWTSIYDSVR